MCIHPAFYANNQDRRRPWSKLRLQWQWMSIYRAWRSCERFCFSSSMIQGGVDPALPAIRSFGYHEAQSAGQDQLQSIASASVLLFRPPDVILFGPAAYLTSSSPSPRTASAA